MEICLDIWPIIYCPLILHIFMLKLDTHAYYTVVYGIMFEIRFLFYEIRHMLVGDISVPFVII